MGIPTAGLRALGLRFRAAPLALGLRIKKHKDDLERPAVCLPLVS